MIARRSKRNFYRVTATPTHINLEVPFAWINKSSICSVRLTDRSHANGLCKTDRVCSLPCCCLTLYWIAWGRPTLVIGGAIRELVIFIRYDFVDFIDCSELFIFDIWMEFLCLAFLFIRCVLFCCSLLEFVNLEVVRLINILDASLWIDTCMYMSVHWQMAYCTCLYERVTWAVFTTSSPSCRRVKGSNCIVYSYEDLRGLHLYPMSKVWMYIWDHLLLLLFCSYLL